MIPWNYNDLHFRNKMQVLEKKITLTNKTTLWSKPIIICIVPNLQFEENSYTCSPDSNSGSVALYSCMIQLVRTPFGALPRWKTSVFFIPITAVTAGAFVRITRSFPVAFQYPASVARFDRCPFGYFRSFGEKKNHSGSSDLIRALSTEPKKEKGHLQELNFSIIEKSHIYKPEPDFRIKPTN